MTNAFDLAAIDAALSATPYTGKLHYFPSIGSTNTYAMQQAQEGAEAGSVYFADEQTAGRGRGGHSWHSAAGTGLYVSILLRPSMASAAVLWLSLAAGLAVHQAVKEVTSLEADLRWPNDLLLGRRKFCGILTEMQAEAARVRYAVVGIGINVHQDWFPPELESLATSLRIETDKEWSRQELLIALLQLLHRETLLLTSAETAQQAAMEIPARVERISSWVRGKQVVVGDPEEFRGSTVGLDARGFLLVRTHDGVQTVLTGGVREARAFPATV
jgi:BirA family transcriptional regulator, biotin operon repressor / biotin---[acetyl-CoA-carboxylase] ligase